MALVDTTPVLPLAGTLAGTEKIPVIKDGLPVQTTVADIANLAGQSDAQFLVASASGGLSAERVATDTATVVWDFATAAQAKANVPDGVFAGVGTLVGMRVFTTGTAATYTPTAGATVAVFELVGGGGGGGAAFTNTASAIGVGGGGGSGGYALKRFTDLTGITYTVGAGGAGGAAGDNPGAAGTDSTVAQGATTITALGGGGGAAANTADSIAALGGAGGAVSTNGDINSGGQAGGSAFGVFASNAAFGGAGGGSRFGGGAAAQATGSAGANAATFGAGGSGAASFDANRAGGNGSAGVIVVWEYK